MKKYYYLYEQTKTVSSHNLNILNETTVSGKPKVIFNTILQEANVKNGNKRVYNQSICESIVSKLMPKVQNKSLLMEIDHPLFISSDPEVLKKRSTIIELNNSAAKIQKLSFDKGKIIAEVSTLSGFKGPDLANLIHDGVNFGFSLRALGSVERLSDGTMNVVEPMIPITYDVVSNPSYQNARILEILPENMSDFISNDQQLLCESQDFKTFIENESIQVPDINTDIYKFLDNVINESLVDVISKKVIFKFWS